MRGAGKRNGMAAEASACPGPSRAGRAMTNGSRAQRRTAPSRLSTQTTDLPELISVAARATASTSPASGVRPAERGRDVAGVDGADAGPGEDLEAHRPLEAAGQVVEHVGEHAGLVGAARPAARHDEREPGH